MRVVGGGGCRRDGGAPRESAQVGAGEGAVEAVEEAVVVVGGAAVEAEGEGGAGVGDQGGEQGLHAPEQADLAGAGELGEDLAHELPAGLRDGLQDLEAGGGEEQAHLAAVTGGGVTGGETLGHQPVHQLGGGGAAHAQAGGELAHGALPVAAQAGEGLVLGGGDVAVVLEPGGEHVTDRPGEEPAEVVGGGKIEFRQGGHPASQG